MPDIVLERHEYSVKGAPEAEDQEVTQEWAERDAKFDRVVWAALVGLIVMWLRQKF